MAKALGCRVIATASGKNEEFLRGLGVDEVGSASLRSPIAKILTRLVSAAQFLDYTKAPLVETLTSNPNAPKINVFLEAVGFTTTDLYRASEKYLAPGGTFLSVGPATSTPGGGVFSYLWTTLLRPTWLGGVRSKFKWASSP